MPDLWRGTLIMTGRGQGWSESYVFPRDNISVANFGQLVMQPIAFARARLLASEYTLQAFRWAKFRLAAGTPVKRQGDLAIPNFEINKGIAGWEGCQPNECVIANGATDDGREKKVFMRGIPDIVITNGGTLNRGEGIGWFSRLDSFFAQLLLNQAGFLIDTPNGDPFNVTTYVINPGYTIQLTFQGTPLAAYDVGARITVRLSGINGKSELNGIRELVVGGPSTATTSEPFSLFAYQQGGVAQVLTRPKPHVVATGWGAEIARTHQTGKVSVGTRGRRPARAKG